MFFIRMMNDLKIRKKLAVTFISVAVLPLLLCGLFLTGKLREMEGVPEETKEIELKIDCEVSSLFFLFILVNRVIDFLSLRDLD